MVTTRSKEKDEADAVPVAVVTAKAKATTRRKGRKKPQAQSEDETTVKKSGLSKLELARFHVHIDSLKHCQFGDLVARRPSVYRENEDKYKKYQQRFEYLKRTKNNKDTVAHWWNLLSKAKELVAEQGDIEDEAIVEPGSKAKKKKKKDDDDSWEPEDLEQAEAKGKAAAKEEAAASKTSAKKPAATETPEADRKPVAKKLKLPPRAPLSQKPTTKMADDASSLGATTVTSQQLFGSPEGKGGMGKNAVRFNSLEEAIEMADIYFIVDLKDPRKNGGPFFFFYESKGIKDSKNKAKYTKLTLTIASIIDVRIRNQCYGYVVCGGEAFALLMPSVPHYLLDIEDIKKLHDSQDNTCEQTKEGHIATAKKILRNQKGDEVKTALFLFKLPYICSADLESDTAPVVDEKKKVYTMKETKLEGQVTVTKKKVTKSYNVVQMVEPGVFDFRHIVPAEDQEVIDDDDSDDSDDVDDYFKELSISSKKCPRFHVGVSKVETTKPSKKRSGTENAKIGSKASRSDGKNQATSTSTKTSGSKSKETPRNRKTKEDKKKDTYATLFGYASLESFKDKLRTTGKNLKLSKREKKLQSRRGFDNVTLDIPTHERINSDDFQIPDMYGQNDNPSLEDFFGKLEKEGTDIVNEAQDKLGLSL